MMVVVPEPLAKRLKSGRASCGKHEVRIVEGKHYVKQFLDLRRIGSTLVYVQIENALFLSTFPRLHVQGGGNKRRNKSVH